MFSLMQHFPFSFKFFKYIFFQQNLKYHFLAGSLFPAYNAQATRRTFKTLICLFNNPTSPTFLSNAGLANGMSLWWE